MYFVDVESNDTDIKKEKRLHDCSYIDVFKMIRNEYERKGYKPSYIVGSSFGFEAEKWRMVLECIDEEFDRFEKYNKAILFTDSVDIKDTVTEDELLYLYYDLLNIKVYSGPGYLHTKFVLIRYEKDSEKEYILFVNSKNISNSQNFDYYIVLRSKATNKANNKNGETDDFRLASLLEHLSSNCEELEELNKIIDELKYLDFELADDEKCEEIDTRIYTFYDKVRTTEDIKKKLLESDYIISPYISKDIIQEINSEAKILSYKSTWDKINNDTFKNKYCGIGWKFHSKIYLNSNEKSIFMGSLNLTKEAFETHCELLVELKPNEEQFNDMKTELKEVFNGQRGIVQKYSKELDEEIENDEIEETESVKRGYKVVIVTDEKRERFYYFSIKGKEATLVYWGEDEFISELKICMPDGTLILKDIYVENSEAETLSDKLKEKAGYNEETKKSIQVLKYCDIKEEAAARKKKSGQLNDEKILLGSKTAKINNVGIGSRKNAQNNMTNMKYGCLNRVIHQRMNENASDKKNELIRVLKELKRSLYGKEIKEYLDEMIKHIDEGK